MTIINIPKTTITREKLLFRFRSSLLCRRSCIARRRRRLAIDFEKKRTERAPTMNNTISTAKLPMLIFIANCSPASLSSATQRREQVSSAPRLPPIALLRPIFALTHVPREKLRHRRRRWATAIITFHYACHTLSPRRRSPHNGSLN